MRDKRDTKKKRFIETLSSQGTVYHAAQAAGVSRQTVYRWRIEDREFAACWDEAHEKAVDAVESSLYQKALNGDLHDLLPQGPPSDVSGQVERRCQASAERNRRETCTASRES